MKNTLKYESLALLRCYAAEVDGNHSETALERIIEIRNLNYI